MLSLKLENRDLVLDAINGLELIQGDEELAQSFTLLIETNITEWFLKPSMGFDYLELQKKNYDVDLIRFALIETLSQDSRFEELLDFQFEVKNRQATITFRALVDERELNLSIQSEVG